MNLDAPEEKLLEAGLLFDTYGELLTERQRTFTRLHFEEDLSFSDIAREYSITRQAVHDSVKHALRTLAELENALGIVAKSMAESKESHIGGRQLIERLENLSVRVRAEVAADKAVWIVKELQSLVVLLGGQQEPGEETAVANARHEMEIERADV